MLADLRLVLRQLRKSPGFTAIAVSSLALGIGTCAAVFSLFNAILLRSLPVSDPQELRVLQWTGRDNRIPSFNGTMVPDGPRATGTSVHHPLFLALREQAKPLADVFGFSPVKEVVARARHDPFVATGALVSDNFFPALRVQPLAGRLFQSGDDAPASGRNVVITEPWWEKQFARSTDAIGQTITLNGHAFTIIGVLPRDFPGVTPGTPPEFYISLQAGSPFLHTDITATRHWFVQLMARLKPGISDVQLQSALHLVFAREAASIMQEPAVQVEPGHRGPGHDRKNYQNPLRLMAGVVGLVLLIACANLAGLSLARGAGRQHDFAVRVALGAGRGQLVRQSLVESLVLAFAGGALGVLVAIWATTTISRLLAGSADGLPYNLSLNGTLLGFSFALALVTALLSGLLPAWRVSRVDALDGLKARGALAVPRLRIGRTLVTAQIALSLLLLTAAGLYLRSLSNLRQIDAGFSTERLLVFDLNPAAVGYKDAALTAFYARAQETLGAIPGVQGATLMQYQLLDNRQWTIGFEIPGRPPPPSGYFPASRLTVGETFFGTLGIPLLHGRGLTAADNATAPKAAVINETFARSYFPNENPLGRTVNIHDVDWQIVGVCRDAKYHAVKADIAPTVYMSFRQYTIRNATSYALRTALPPLALTRSVREAVAALDPSVPVAGVTTQDDLRDKNIAQERLLAALCGALAGLALLLSCLGLFGLMAYNVARRTSEIGLRMALGAGQRDVARAVLREALGLAALGVALGLPAAFALTRLIEAQLYGVRPNDPATLIAVTAMLIAVTLAAAWLPARRAMRVDPMIALRAE